MLQKTLRMNGWISEGAIVNALRFEMGVGHNAMVNLAGIDRRYCGTKLTELGRLLTKFSRRS